MAAFANAQVGQEYGFATIVSIVLSLLTTGRLRFQLAGQRPTGLRLTSSPGRRDVESLCTSYAPRR